MSNCFMQHVATFSSYISCMTAAKEYTRRAARYWPMLRYFDSNNREELISRRPHTNTRHSATLSGPGRPSWPSSAPVFAQIGRRTSRRSGSPGSSSSLRGDQHQLIRGHHARSARERSEIQRVTGETLSPGGGWEMLARWAEISLRVSLEVVAC